METLTRLAAPWASFYNDAPALQTLVLFAHLAGMLIAGGFALAADRATLRAASALPAERTRHLAELGATHRPVVLALAVTVVSGVLMLAADVETLLGSVAFWTKMGLIVLLLGNGYVLRHSGKALSRKPEGSWSRLRAASMASVALWLAVVLAGAALNNLS